MSDLKKIVIIAGPTCSGKSSYALHWALKNNGEIVNADSRQIYKDMFIGVAAPSQADFEQVPHHLFHFLEPRLPFNAGEYSRIAREVVDEILLRGKTPVLVGGTGLYVRTFLYGVANLPLANSEIRGQLEERIQKEGLNALHHELQKIDPVAAKRIHSSDPARIIRALEIYYMTNKTWSELIEEHQFQQSPYQFQYFVKNLERDELYQKINERVHLMIEQGLKDEVAALIKKYGWTTVLQKAIGYAEWQAHFNQGVSQNEVIEKIQQNTRHFAKRQVTWFKKEKEVVWI